MSSLARPLRNAQKPDEQLAPPIPFERLRELIQQQIAADKNLRVSHRLIGIAITWYLNRKSGTAWPGTATLASRTTQSKDTVKRARKELETAGHFRIIRKHGRPNQYLPLLKEQATEGGQTRGITMHPVNRGPNNPLGAQLCTQGGGIAMHPEPLREPLNKDPNFNLGREGSKEEREGLVEKASEGLISATPKPSLKAERNDQAYYWKYLEERERRFSSATPKSEKSAAPGLPPAGAMQRNDRARRLRA